MAVYSGLLALAALLQITSVLGQVCPDYMASGGCSAGPCTKGGVKGKFRVPSDCPLLIGYGTGAFKITGTVADDTAVPSSKGSDNAKFFPGTKIKASSRRTPSKCCALCKSKTNCKFWQHLSVGAYGGICFTYNGPSGPVCDSGVIVKTRVAAKCAETVKNDPHFVGAQGVHYDFNGVPGQSFCLLTDRNLHMNMKMTGYLDSRTESASLIKDGKAVRTWIRELGLIWLADGQKHSLRLIARAGKETARGEGYLALAEVDESPLARLQVGNELALDGGLVIKLQAVEKSGPYDVDVYTVRIGDMLDMDVRLRVADPLLRTPEEAQVHISLGINSIKTTPSVHGVLGQTYQDGRENRTAVFNRIREALHHDISADGESGNGFLDGRSEDYRSSAVMEPDCRFSQFQQEPKVTVSSD